MTDHLIGRLQAANAWLSMHYNDEAEEHGCAIDDAILALEALAVPEGYVLVPREHLREIFRDYMTSEKHHPDHVLISKVHFEALRDVFDNASPTIPDDIKSAGVDIPAGMVPWNGGDSAPEDWDDAEPILSRRGHLVYGMARQSPSRWTHLGSVEDIIAYTPKRTPPPASDASDAVGEDLTEPQKAVVLRAWDASEQGELLDAMREFARFERERANEEATPSNAGEKALRALNEIVDLPRDGDVFNRAAGLDRAFGIARAALSPSGRDGE